MFQLRALLRRRGRRHKESIVYQYTEELADLLEAEVAIANLDREPGWWVIAEKQAQLWDPWAPPSDRRRDVAQDEAGDLPFVNASLFGETSLDIGEVAKRHRSARLKEPRVPHLGGKESVRQWVGRLRLLRVGEEHVARLVGNAYRRPWPGVDRL